MNFQEAFWLSRGQQQYQQPINLVDPTTRVKPKLIMNNHNNNNSPHSLSFSHQDDIDNDQFPDQDDQQSTTTTINNTTRTAQDYYTIVDREPMFEKPLTPSDVGKLNRLVIPKQHAEKYFPLNGGSTTGGGGESTGEKGLVLSFEDELGKGWRFRYSYWNSSQSYVLTKGWSRFVKEKKLDAGDVVLFDRHKVDLDRFFIGWRKRGAGGRSSNNYPVVVQGGDAIMAAPSTTRCGGGGWSTNIYNYNAPPNYHQQAGYSSLTAHSFPESTDQPQLQVGAARGGDYLHLRKGTGVEHEKAPAAPAITCGNKKKSSTRRLRLFGVNLECHQEDVDCSAELDQTSDGSSLSSGGGTRGTGSARTNNTNVAAAAPSNYYYYNNNNSYYDYLGYPS